MNQEAIAKKISALMKMTIKNGCTEAEAMSAMGVVQNLMKQYDMSYDDVGNLQQKISDERYGWRRIVLGTENNVHSISFICHSLASFYDCRVVYEISPDKEYVMMFFGTFSDSLLARDTMNMLMQAMDNGFHSFVGSAKLSNRLRKFRYEHYSSGFNHRIRERLLSIKEDRTSATDVSKSLVVMKDSEITERLENSGYAGNTGKEVTIVQQEIDPNDPAFISGMNNADKIHLTTNKKRIDSTKKVGEGIHK